MPIIRVLSGGDNDDQLNQGQAKDSAAAVMAVLLEGTSQPIKEPSRKVRRRQKGEKPQQGNPHRLTIRQHVFPIRSIARFVNERELVHVYDVVRKKAFHLPPKDMLFCADRAWDHRAEGGYMKRTEDEFQAIVEPIIGGHAASVAPEQKASVDKMFALWYMRSRYRELDQQEYQLRGIAGDRLSKAEEEILEKKGYLFARSGGRIPARQLNGLQLQMRMDHYAHQLAARTKWGVIRSESGEFLVPDVPTLLIIPLAPDLALVGDVEDGRITEQNLGEINRATKGASCRYYFSRELSECPT